ncbi:MAG: lysophospholipid acyltransferase family protein [Pseudobdellovibrionaceae bacterium]
MELWFRKYFLGFIVWLFFKSLSLTWRVTVEEPESMKDSIRNQEPLVFAHWHGDEVALIYLIGRYRIATITSTSKDGEMMNTVIHLLGGVTTRGSSTRGAINALKGLVRIVRDQKRNSSFAVDGPKGPLHQVKPGVFEISRLLGGPIYSVGVACDRKWVFEKAWNKAYLPKPFARIHMQWMGPVGPVTREQDPRSPVLAQDLSDALRNAEREALKKIAAPSRLS